MPNRFAIDRTLSPFARAVRRASTSLSVRGVRAARRGDRRVSTDHLLVGILHDPAVAQQIGADPDEARHLADEMDREALLAVGITIGGHGPLAPGASATSLPFIPAAKA